MAIEADVKQEIEALTAALAAALKQSDGPAAAALFTEEAFLLPPGRRMVIGRADIETFWTNTLQRLVDAGITVTSARLFGSGASRGIGRLTMKFDSQQPQEIINKFLLVAERFEAVWKIESLSWNRVASPQVKTPQVRQNRQQAAQVNEPGTYGKVSGLYAR
jgi:uncharacterized protein (TIGR02246 family)